MSKLSKNYYEKPMVEKISFAIQDMLMDGGTIPPVTGSGQGSTVEPWSLDGKGAYQILP